MTNKRIFSDLYNSLNTQRIILILVLLGFVITLMVYFNNVRKSLEEREEKYAKLYAESIRFFIEKSANSECDYTFVQEVLSANETVPTILVTNGSPTYHLNINELDDSTHKMGAKEKETFLYKKIEQMQAEHQPIKFTSGNDTGYVYYSNSNIVKQLYYFPYVLIFTFLVFGIMTFITYSSSRKAEQNRVWVGLAKETAHQLGTPISGLLGWIEVLKMNPDFDKSLGDEMLKDIKRLETITNRFSNIGSEAVMKDEHLSEIVETTAEYLKKRISTKVNWTITNKLQSETPRKVNRNLIEWVVENLCKNAVDAMEGIGQLEITIMVIAKDKIAIDFKDSGKGMNAQLKRKVFNPGFSTKTRGWGLGLTLAKRIIESYHKGQIFIADSNPGKGTTFRIIL